MLPLKLVEEIKRQLDEGQHSQRSIARSLGVSRGTVHAIATGKRGLHGCDHSDDHAARISAQRCPSCGARVYMPCILCRARAYRRQPFSRHEPRPKRVA